ncbi:MAG TPA: hypothetical protein VK177_14700 [Flavobacteriales bacterium]|nr:hypothetical protein [Flavobacteriales bacterium]
MKNNLALLLAFAALGLAIAAFYNSTQTSHETGSNHKSLANKVEDEPQVEIEIADIMLYIQHFHNKVYLASKAGNDKLAVFYLNEMGEKMNEISKANLWSNGVNISENMRTYGLKTIDQFLEKKSVQIYESFENLTSACNSCHIASKHSDIKIKTPVDAVYYNQDFSK